MKAILLVAGRASRPGDITTKKPKEVRSLPVFDMFIPKLETGKLWKIKKLKALAAA